MNYQTLFSALGPGFENILRDNNPWWKGEREYGLPDVKRWAFSHVLDNLKSGMTPAVILKGPRQVGKTTLLKQAINALLEEGIDPKRIFRVQFDELESLEKMPNPILELARWYSENILKKSFNQAANDGQQAFIFLDEVQNLPKWDAQLKHLVDIHPVKVLVTGSSALRIESGRDSLAGRIFTVEMGPLLLREIAQIRRIGSIAPILPFNGTDPLKSKELWLSLKESGLRNSEMRDKAFIAFSERGAYPKAQVEAGQPWEKVSDFLAETVIKRAIIHDLRMGSKGQRRDQHLLEEVFRLACRYTGQSPRQSLYLNEIRTAMSANIGWQRILTYLKFLDGTLLLRMIEPLELRLKKKRGASKICLCDHSLRASWLKEIVPLDPAGLRENQYLADIAGHIAEGIAGYFFSTINGLEVSHFPERSAEPEVDFVLTVGLQRIPVEVKYRDRIDYEDTLGLRSFIEKAPYNAPFGILVSSSDDVKIDDPRIVALPLSSLLFLR